MGIGLACAGFASDADFTLSVQPLFEGASPMGGTYPLAIDIQNSGGNARGVVRVEGSDFEMTYPVDLPRGANKRIIAYTPGEALMMSDLTVTLNTSNGNAQKRLPPTYGMSEYGAKSFLLISDTSGLMTFFRRQGNEERPAGSDLYGRPGMLPDRPSAYEGISAVIFGEGSERLMDTEISALKTWLLSGGHLVFVGGASSPILADPRWRPILPIQNVKPQTMIAPASFAVFGGTAPPAKPMSVLIGDPTRDAKVLFASGGPLIVQHSVGLGTVSYLAFNPFEPPLDTWKGRRKLFANFLQTESGLRKRTQLLQSVTDVMNQGEGPFNVEMPSSGKVFLILLGYLVVVVPVNFLILRKFRAGEKAWITAPIISVGFAALLFALSGNLYSFDLSTETTGILLVDPRVEDAYFIGRSQLFFPRGGRYDLQLSGVDSLQARSMTEDTTLYTPYRRYRGGQNQPKFDAVDVGEILVPEMPVSNLSFREFWFSQRIPLKEMIRTEGLRMKYITSSSARLSGTIINNSPFTINDASIGTQAVVKLGDLPPGKRIKVNGRIATGEQDNHEGEAGQTVPLNAIAIRGKLVGFRPGPQIGRGITDGSNVDLVYFLSDRGNQ